MICTCGHKLDVHDATGCTGRHYPKDVIGHRGSMCHCPKFEPADSEVTLSNKDRAELLVLLKCKREGHGPTVAVYPLHAPEGQLARCVRCGNLYFA